MSIEQLLTKLGVPADAGAEGVVQTKIMLHNAGQLKDLLDIGLSPAGRAEHAAALLDGISAPAGNQDVPLVHKLIGFAVGNDELSADDHAQLAAALPLTAHVVSAPPTAPPTVVSGVWDVSNTDDSLKVINLSNGLELQDGGCIVARATPLHFTCASLTRTGNPPAGYSGDFNILGRPGTPELTPLAPGGVGQAQSGAPGQCSSAGVAGEGGGNGSPGQQGTAGQPGGAGNNGIASALATIVIQNTLTLDPARQFLAVATQSGPGGQGGSGGPGGPGQQGGNGGNGATCDCTGNGGGSAGPGGKGGTGGPAGDGGDGADAAGNIFVYLPATVSTSVVQAVPSAAPPGGPGNPGPGGPGGAPGTAGSAGKNNSAGGAAGSGGFGDPGSPGRSGTHTGTSATITALNGQP
jgi:hypothetical protein